MATPPQQPEVPTIPGSGTGAGAGAGKSTTTTQQLLPPGFILTRCDPASDIPRMVDIYIDAFSRGDYVYWWGPIATMRAWNAERTSRWFDDPAEALFKVVVDDEGGGGEGGKIVAFARWVLPRGMRGVGLRAVPLEQGGEVGDENKAGEDEGKPKENETNERSGNVLPDVPEGVDAELCREMFGSVRDAGKKWGASEKLELSILCTDPAYHGRGIGAALIRHGLEVADAEGFAVYLDALSLAAPLYERLGFEVVDKLEFPLARARIGRDPILRVMVRQPRGGQT